MQQPPNEYTHYPPPPPPQFQQPMLYPPPPPKKSNKRVWVGIAIVFGLLLLWGGVMQALGGPAQPGTDTSSQATQPVATPTQAVQPTAQAAQPTTQPTVAPTAIPPTPTPVPMPKWTTTHTWNGNGAKKTEIFTAPGDWKILYACTYQNIGGVTGDGALAVNVYGSDGSIIDIAINATCKDGVAKTTGETEEHQGGQVYLDVNGTGDWTIQVQELK